MLQFILTDILFLSLGAVLYIVVRSLPRMHESEPRKSGLLERWVISEIPERMDAAIGSFSAKFFRRMRIYTMKLDNALNKKIQSAKSDAPVAITDHLKKLSEEKVASEEKTDNNS